MPLTGPGILNWSQADTSEHLLTSYVYAALALCRCCIVAGLGFVKGTSHFFPKQTNKSLKPTQKGVGLKNFINQQLKGTEESRTW